MSATLRMRERVQSSRRNCLMRKVHLCEYLLGYGHSLDLRTSPRNSTANSFFPHINYHAALSAPSTPAAHRTPNPDPAFTITVQNDSPAFLPRAASKTSRRQALRPCDRRLPPAGISELTAKTMTPSTRLWEGDDANFITRTNRSTIHSSRKGSMLRRLSPRKRTYIGGVHYVKDESITQPLTVAAPRKLSIAPWDIELEYL